MTEMEKLTINLGPVDLGQIELLVEQGFYPNRAEFVRAAVQNQLGKHAENLREAAVRQAYVIGALSMGRSGLEKQRKSGVRSVLRVVGLLSIAHDVTPELALATIESVKVHGIFRASPAVKAALAERMA